MTERKPPGVKWESWVEKQIREAQQQGDFDDLLGKGKPISDLGRNYDPNWWVKQLLQREQLSLSSPALQIRAKVERELEKIWRCVLEEDVRSRIEALNAEIAKVNRTSISGPPTSVAVIDVEAVVCEWRQRRSRE
jgi:hypothetical protein